MKGWVMLLAQPYSKDYSFDTAKESVQRNLYADALKQLPDNQWIAVVSWWVKHETRWPLLADINTHLTRMFPPSKSEPLTAKALLAAPINPSCEPWQGVVVAWVRGGGDSVYATGVPILREWVRRHPGDMETLTRLQNWEQKLGAPQKAA